MILEHIFPFVNHFLCNFALLGEKMFEKIKELCKEKGISVLTLEKETGIAHGIHRWDTSKPSVDKVKAVADYFGVSVDYILKGEGELTDGYTTISKLSLNDDVRELLSVIERCSPNEIQTITRLAKALRGESIYDAPTTPKIADLSKETPQKV